MQQAAGFDFGRALGDEPAHPFTEHNDDGSHYCDNAGLTKRELIAAMAMQGFASDPSCTGEASVYAGVAVKWADALLAELAKEPKA